MLLPLPPLAERALREAQALISTRRLQEAAAAVRRARAAAPTHAGIPHGVAEALARQGLAREALQQRFLACHLDPHDAALRRALVEALPGADLSGASPAVMAQLDRLLYAPDVSPLDVGPVVLRLLRTLPGFSLLSQPAEQQAALAEPASQALLTHPLWQSLLARCLITDPSVELMLAGLRQQALARLGPQPQRAPAGLLAESLEPLAALALQTTLSAQAWLETPEESAAVESLARHLAAAPPAQLDAPALVLACYRPLPDWPLPAPEGPRRLREAWQRLLDEPRRRAALGAALPSLTAVQGEVTSAVRAQYEANPYPRWIGTNLAQPRPLAQVLTGLFPWLEAEALPQARPLQLLIAGCGTGEQALRTASRFLDSQVLAVDLSRASLGFAALRAEQVGLGNLRFAQADLMALGGLEQRFDAIECVGVLHHLADPAAGWRVLRGLLAPGGVMRIALYSRLARAPLAEVRRLVGAGDGRPPTAARLREARATLFANTANPAVAFVLDYLDAYDLDGLRDMLFHAQEVEFSLPEIGRLLQDLDLRLLGFELTERDIGRAFRKRFPAPGAEQDLAAWHSFEQENPRTFRSMYRFWCQTT